MTFGGVTRGPPPLFYKDAPAGGGGTRGLFLFIERELFTTLDKGSRGSYIGIMREVGISKLKNRLGEYIRLAREGEVVLVTDHGEVVAELRSAEPVDLEIEREYPALAEMARKGLVRLPLKPNRPGIYPLLPSVTPPGTAARLLDEDRGER
ncbi:MAG TPA: type II toxin-antitoxin system prevent-host-death family antitoxin [Thermoanaerobaculia bacterium]|nr:type II toxin-antitoxin system prevent-host-death family antitoxin [Thermoanaerobaculia bacterium]